MMSHTNRNYQLYKIVIGLVISATLILILCIQIIDQEIFILREYDPQMPYLLNSLAVFREKSFYYIDHPGTPVELLGSFFLLLTRPLSESSTLNFISYNLAFTAAFYTVAYIFLTISSIAIVGLILFHALKINRYIDFLYIAAISVIFFASMPNLAFRTLTMWSHNSFTFILGTLVLFLVLFRLRTKSNLHLWEAAVFGILTGLLVSIQLYFLTWVISVVIILVGYSYLQGESVKELIKIFLVVLISSVVGFVIFTLPIVHRYISFFSWVKAIITHQGRYGLGPEGVASIEGLLQNIKSLWDSTPTIFVASVICLILLLIAMLINRKDVRENPDWWALSIGVSFQLIITLGIVLKHPGDIYLLAVAALLPIILTLVVIVLRRNGGLGRTVLMLLSVAILLGYLYGIVSTIHERLETAQATVAERTNFLNFKNDLGSKTDKSTDEFTVLWGYGTLSQCFGLRFGDIYTNYAFSRDIETLCPRDWMYDIWYKRVIGSDAPTSIEVSTSWDILVVEEGTEPVNVDEIGAVFRSDVGPYLYIVSKNLTE